MLTRRGFLTSCIGSVAVCGLDVHALRAAAQGSPPPQIPPVSYSCPMHAEVVDNEPGKCPICAMELKPVRLALVWSCSVHTEVAQPQPGKCRQCGRDLIRVTKALTFTCPVHRKVDVLDPGKCPVCKRTLVAKYSVRPHGDHNPKHGGYFFMVSNNWHVEVTHPSPSVFRLYTYDEYSKPFAPPGLAARIVEAPDAGGKKKTDVSIPFTRAPRAGFMEARIPGLALPANIAAKVRFEAGDREYRFDFMFAEYSKDPVVPGRK